MNLSRSLLTHKVISGVSRFVPVRIVVYADDILLLAPHFVAECVPILQSLGLEISFH